MIDLRNAQDVLDDLSQRMDSKDYKRFSATYDRLRAENGVIENGLCDVYDSLDDRHRSRICSRDRRREKGTQK